MTDTWTSQSSIHTGFGGSAPSAGGGEGEIAAPPADRGLRRGQQEAQPAAFKEDGNSCYNLTRDSVRSRTGPGKALPLNPPGN
ncbi:hypothetical protein LEMLEM_LOCUS20926 [Lemmus lemmus]